jgi:uncharacterized protein (DUF488 family)
MVGGTVFGEPMHMAEGRMRGTLMHLDRERFETTPTVLLCSERTAEYCHRRLVLEYLGSKWSEVVPMHL